MKKRSKKSRETIPKLEAEKTTIKKSLKYAHVKVINVVFSTGTNIMMGLISCDYPFNLEIFQRAHGRVEKGNVIYTIEKLSDHHNARLTIPLGN